MRILTLALAVTTALALAGAAQAGEGCAYSKSQTTAAAGDVSGANGHHGDCSDACTEAHVAAGACGCSQVGAEAEIASNDAGQAALVRTQDGAELAASD